MILSYTLILPVSQLQTQQPMMSQIEYLIPTCNIFVLILYSNLVENSSLTDGFNTI